MKTNIFSFSTFIIIFSLLLSSCSNLFTPPTNTPTPVPSNTPTITPSPTVTPTPTPDGATGFDSKSKLYTKTENGKTYYWVPMQINTADTQKGHWFRSLMLNDKSIPLLDWEDNSNLSDWIPITAYVEENVPGAENLGFLSHPDMTSITNTGGMYLPGTIMAQLGRRYSGEKDVRKISQDEWYKLNTGIERGVIPIPFTTPYGRYEWKPSPTRGYKFFAIAWDDADPAKYPEFNETQDEMKRKNLLYRWTIFTDAEGTLITVGAVKEPQNLTDVEYLEWILWPIAKVILDEELPANIDWWGFWVYPWWDAGGFHPDRVNYIEIIRNP